ncbi:RelA/SpoT domain-containing protein [Williamsia muralis]|uniref:RelA/SpoT domain-containing protein n=1 Tax=Williamsia marianensis TaxID=85044 RepID=A0ABU4EZX7_WILMA|nr:RelA/SpoT domain-containing protein [Williamsia muralis]MDV7135491.1 RelA/SpoT domain-containing protein [Williamsia muralis]
MTDLPSKSQINKCGETIRQWRYEGRDVTSEDIEHALAVIRAFREAHAYPLAKVRYGLRSMIRTENAHEAIGQRLKRVPRIVRKLQRTANSPTGRTALARLEDIGGVRAVLADGAELERVRKRIERNWSSVYKRPPRDYIAVPKAEGYRAVHFVVVRDDRAIEVQLRTRGQQQWADAAEAADARLASRGVKLKDGDAPPEILEYFSAAGEMIHRREYGLDISPELVERFGHARTAVVDAGYYRR